MGCPPKHAINVLSFWCNLVKESGMERHGGVRAREGFWVPEATPNVAALRLGDVGEEFSL